MLNKIIIFAAIFYLLPYTALAGPMGPGGPPAVVTAAISEADIVPAIEYIGHAEAIQSVDLRARVEGFLEEVRFKEGSFVHAGDILYVIEQAAYKARVAADEARVAQAKAELKRADSHLKRLKSARTESIPATDMDNAIAADLDAKARLAGAKAALSLSQLNFDYTTIKAPISGRIGRTAYTIGNLVNPASGSLARIVQLDPIRVVYSISENDLAAIQKSMHNTTKFRSRLLSPNLRLANGDAYQESGYVSFVDNQIDPATGTIAVRAEFSNKAGSLIPGQYVTIQVKEGAPKIMPVVPQVAVLAGKDGRYVLMVEHGIATPRAITIGPMVGNGWAVKSGLKIGEKIIVSGLQKVRPGMPVTVAPLRNRGEKK